MRTGQGTGQIRRKVKKDEIGIGITDAGSLSLKAGEGAGVYTTKYKRVVEKTRLLRYLTCPYSFRLGRTSISIVFADTQAMEMKVRVVVRFIVGCLVTSNRLP